MHDPRRNRSEIRKPRAKAAVIDWRWLLIGLAAAAALSMMLGCSPAPSGPGQDIDRPNDLGEPQAGSPAADRASPGPGALASAATGSARIGPGRADAG